jgi:hypothetical protein
MRRLWVHSEFDVPAGRMWELLVDTRAWPRWGPSVRDASLDGEVLAVGATGKVTTAMGATLPFRITALEPGESWSWEVAGVPATDHLVTPLGADRCRVGFGVPWVAAPYLTVCRVALRRMRQLVDGQG